MEVNKIHKLIKRALTYILMTFLAFIFIGPIIFMFVSTLKIDQFQLIKDMSSVKAFVPYGKLGLDNFYKLFNNMNVTHYFFNSVFITITTIGIGVIFNSMVAYSLAILKFRGKKIILALIVAMLVIPGEAIIVPNFLLVNKLGIINSYVVQIIPFVADAFSIFLFYQLLKEIPVSLVEAAIIDGSSYFGIYLRIALPLSKSTIATVLILNALSRWGDLLWPIMVTRGDKYRPLPLALQQLFSTYNGRWGEILALAAIITLPILLVFILFQKQFVASIASSGSKE